MISAQPAIVASPSFTDELWASIGPTYAAILRHPFVTGLTDGSLPRDRFAWYVVQDALYLRSFARALAITGAGAPNDDWFVMLAEHAANAIRVERSLHAGFIRDLGLTAEEAAVTPLAPTTTAYTSYLLAAAHGQPFHRALAALLPCYWIYWEVGKELARAGSPDPLYARWIATYASPEFGGAVRAVLDATDQVAADLGPADRAAMLQHFGTTSRYEWLFWEMGYRRESWPLGGEPGVPGQIGRPSESSQTSQPDGSG